jgi:protein-S-isoprenylcysteine O-methyltransferase Ste14
LPVFASGLGLVLFDSTIFVWIASEIFGAALVPQLRRRGAVGVRRDRGSRVLITFAILVSVLIGFYFGYAGVGAVPDWIFYAGIFLMFLGVLIRQYSIAILGRFFSLSVNISEDHKVVDKGPYRLVRHPSYTGVLLTLTGLGLAVQSLGAVFVLVLFFGISFGYRMYVEERALLSGLGQDYASYMKRTKRLIPFVF